MTRHLIAASIAFKSFLARKQEGATMVEYGLMVALIAAVCVTIVTTLGGQVKQAFATVSGAM